MVTESGIVGVNSSRFRRKSDRGCPGGFGGGTFAGIPSDSGPITLPFPSPELPDGSMTNFYINRGRFRSTDDKIRDTNDTNKSVVCVAQNVKSIALRMESPPGVTVVGRDAGFFCDCHFIRRSNSLDKTLTSTVKKDGGCPAIH